MQFRQIQLRILVPLIILLNVYPGRAQDRWSDYLESDFKSFKGRLGLKTLLYSGGVLGSMYLLSYHDEYLTERAQSLTQSRFNTYFKLSNHFGNARFTAPAAFGLAGLTLLGNNEQLQDAAFTSAEALLVTSVFTVFAKMVFGRSRPQENKGPLHFKPFSGINRSFPSGHTSTAFAIFVPWVYYYPNPFTYLLLTIPAGTGLARIILNKHWATDVVSGAILGSAVGYCLARWHRDRANVKNYYTQGPEAVTLIKISLPLHR